jgi:hypothetical protein
MADKRAQIDQFGSYRWTKSEREWRSFFLGLGRRVHNILLTDFDSACLLQIDDKDGGLCLKRGSDYYLILATAKSYDRASAEILMIDKMIGQRKITEAL